MLAMNKKHRLPRSTLRFWQTVPIKHTGQRCEKQIVVKNAWGLRVCVQHVLESRRYGD